MRVRGTYYVANEWMDVCCGRNEAKRKTERTGNLTLGPGYVAIRATYTHRRGSTVTRYFVVGTTRCGRRVVALGLMRCTALLLAIQKRGNALLIGFDCIRCGNGNSGLVQICIQYNFPGWLWASFDQGFCKHCIFALVFDILFVYLDFMIGMQDVGNSSFQNNGSISDPRSA